MNVAIFTDNDFSKVNGVTTTLKAVLEHVPDDVDARIYTCEDETIESPEYVALKARGMNIPFYPDMKMYWPPFRQFLRRAIDDRVDLVHFTTPGPVGLAAMYVASKLGVPMVGSFHTDLAEYARLLSGSTRLGDLMREYMRWPYGKCSQILVPSEATRQTLVDSRIDAARIRIWKRGVSAERFSPARRSPVLREHWGVDENRLALLYVGRVSKEKGLALLTPLGERLRKSGVDHQLIVAGDGPMRNDLEAACPNAIFTGTLTTDEVADAMASSDIFVFPSRTETAGNVVLEAQASGLPVLVTDAGGAREQMLDGRTGHVCDGLADFHAHIVDMAFHPEHRSAMSSRARSHALDRRWSVALDPLFRAYRDAVASSQVPRALDPRPAVVG